MKLEVTRMPKLIYPERSCRRNIISINDIIIDDLIEGLDELRRDYDDRVSVRVRLFEEALGVKAEYGRGIEQGD
jgi:hypothetical protein